MHKPIRAVNHPKFQTETLPGVVEGEYPGEILDHEGGLRYRRFRGYDSAIVLLLSREQKCPKHPPPQPLPARCPAQRKRRANLKPQAEKNVKSEAPSSYRMTSIILDPKNLANFGGTALPIRVAVKVRLSSG